MSHFWRQAIEIARIDLVTESRAGELIRLTIPFAVAAVVIFPIALGLDSSLVRATATAAFWTLGLLFGTQVALGISSDETPERRDLHALLGLDPAAHFLGRLLSGTVHLLALFATVLTAVIVLYDADLRGEGLLGLVLGALMVAPGLSGLAALAGDVASGLRTRTSLASLLIVPLALPLILGATQWIEALERGTSILPWVLLLVASDLALVVLGVATADSLEEASR